MDAYRLDSVLEAEELDLETMLAQGALLIEWPERIQELIPPERLWIRFDYADAEEREMKVTSAGSRYDDLLEVIRQASDGGA
jgi:tRNA threonylcarbamoyladenosine biosynthesis protein TsaE